MITKSKLVKFITTDKQEFESLEAAIVHELAEYLKQHGTPALQEHAMAISMALIEDREKVADILTLTETSRPSARKINRKPRAKKSTTPASVETALKYQAGLANTQEPQPV